MRKVTAKAAKRLRKRAEEQIEMQNAELRERVKRVEILEKQQAILFDAAPVGIILVANRTMLSANRRFCEMSGYSPDEIIGASTRILYPTFRTPPHRNMI